MKKLTADDPITHSKVVIAENVSQLKALIPEAFTEGKVDFAVLRQLLGGAVDDREEKYGLAQLLRRRYLRRYLPVWPSHQRPAAWNILEGFQGTIQRTRRGPPDLVGRGWQQHTTPQTLS